MNPADYVYATGKTHPDLMEIDTAIMLIERIGLPAVIIGIMCVFIMKTQKAHREEIIRWEEKDSVGDSRLIDVIKEQNRMSSTTAEAINGLTVAYKDNAKATDRLGMEIKGMAEALIRTR